MDFTIDRNDLNQLKQPSRFADAFTGLQDGLNCFKAECSLYICLQGSKFPDETSQMLFILSYMKGRAAGTWVMHKIQQVLNPSGAPMMMDKFEAEVDLVFADPNQEAMVCVTEALQPVARY